MIGTNRSVSTYRLVNATSPDNTTAYSGSTTHSGIDVYIESLRVELDLVLGTKPGVEAYMMYADAEEMTDVRVSDKVVDNKSNIYFVQGIKRHEENDDTCNLLEILLHKQQVRYTD
jgi:hypothetical protein